MCNKQNVEEIDVEVCQGTIQRTEEYKDLGNMINEKFNMDEQIKLMESKL